MMGFSREEIKAFVKHLEEKRCHKVQSQCNGDLSREINGNSEAA
jgi:hypothetical protein